MTPSLATLMTPIIVLTGSHALQAAMVIDQSNYENLGIMGSLSNGDQAQSFQQSADNIVGAGILLRGDASETITISLYDILPTPLNGVTPLATGTTQGAGNFWADVYWDEVSINPNTTYYLVISGNLLATAADVENHYDRGIYFHRTTGYSTYDLAFRTYANSDTIPEPGSSLMFLVGLGVIGINARRRPQ